MASSVEMRIQILLVARNCFDAFNPKMNKRKTKKITYLNSRRVRHKDESINRNGKFRNVQNKHVIRKIYFIQLRTDCCKDQNGSGSLCVYIFLSHSFICVVRHIVCGGVFMLVQGRNFIIDLNKQSRLHNSLPDWFNFYVLRASTPFSMERI